MKRPYEVFQRSVVNQSARNGIPLLIVIHCTEGQNILNSINDLRNLGDWFDNPAAQCSAHVGVDAEGHSAMYVRDSRKAWHVAEFNSSALGIEMIGRAAQTFWPDKQMRKSAKYVAYWSKRYGYPVRKAKVNTRSGAILRSGVIRHSELGTLGGNHNDPGTSFKMTRLLWLARFYRAKG